ncbi:MAG: cell division protein FtsZ [Paludibacteraceae bacterium]|jgi:cell division protein FtsZ|nr:cell division protein FtsZ [Paludibacteraceae bacterium]
MPSMINLNISNIQEQSIIKVIGVGGGGSNAVNHMYEEGIKDVSFLVCNTDYQDLQRSPVPCKLQLGINTTKGLGCGANPEIGKMAAEESADEIKRILETSNTKMVFITAGMGGGTGTGGAPVIASIAHDLGILTVGIVTIPFKFEMGKKIAKAMLGVAEMRKHVDALLVINNERLIELYKDFSLANAFKEADNILTEAAKGIAEIITVQGYMNVDFADANTILKDGGVAIMNTGMAEGENRVINALKEALASPLLKCNDVRGAKRILINIYTSTTNEVIIKEIEELKAFLNGINENLEEFIWGATYDDNLEETIKVTIIATGFELDNITGNIKEETKQVETNTESNEKINKMVDEYYGENEQKSEAPPSIIDPFEEDYNKKEEVISLDLWADGEDFDEPAYKRNK